MQQVQELLRETVDIAVATGPRGLMRGLQAAQAVASLAGEYASSAATGRQLDPPQRVLRRLFEKLGVTFVKLGVKKRSQRCCTRAGCCVCEVQPLRRQACI